MAEYLYDAWAPRTSRAVVLGMGAVDTAAGASSPLSVKQYTVSGVSVWASYQSPVTDTVLRSMKAQANRFGVGLDANGLIGPKTVDALQKIAGRYTGPLAPQSRVLAGLATSPEAVARQGRAIYGLLFGLANDAGMPTVGSAGSSGEAGPAKAPRPSVVVASSGGGLTSPITPYATPDMGTSIGAMFSNMSNNTKMVLGAGFVVAVFAATRAAKKAGGGKRRGR